MSQPKFYAADVRSFEQSAKEEQMKIKPDYSLCEANAVCEQFAPGSFHVDDDDNLHILEEPTDATLAAVKKAVNSCPRAALELVED